ncbi:ATP-dependent DNA helicase [Trichonephila clavipes]|nr:ATP-dependent DNA helicase [Trichonephila clavipes]
MLQETQTGDDGCSLYCCRKPGDGGHVASGRVPESGMLEDVHNSWVVPYSPLLCINVEYGNSVKSIKHICKYVTKGSDAAMFLLLQMKCRTGLMRYPTVVYLIVHLEGGQKVYYEPGQPTAHLTDTPPKTTLTAFFDLCKADPLAKTLLYSEVPRHFLWDANQKVWQIRKKVYLLQISRNMRQTMPWEECTLHPNSREEFYMRLLLHHVGGPISFEDLKTVIVRDEDEDFLRQTRRNNPTENIEYCDALFNNTLLILEDNILAITGNNLALYGLPEPVHDKPELTSKDVLRETSYDVQALLAYMAARGPRLTPDQQQAFIAIPGMIGSERGGIVFLDALGGTGKTFLFNLLLAFVKKEKDMALAVASSGIAATLLAGGRTAHSAFRLPLDLARSDSATCNISKGTEQGHVLKTCKLIVWDEATMSHRNVFHALDKT